MVSVHHLLITRLSSSVLVAQMPFGRGLASVIQVDMAHTGQPTLLCHQTLRLRALRKVAVDGVLTWLIFTCMPVEVTQSPGRFFYVHSGSSISKQWHESQLKTMAWQWQCVTCVTFMLATHGIHLCKGSKNTFSSLHPAFGKLIDVNPSLAKVFR